jgi:hypothetical protein
MHEHGVASEPGLYFVALDFLYSFTSENVAAWEGMLGTSRSTLPLKVESRRSGRQD